MNTEPTPDTTKQPTKDGIHLSPAEVQMVYQHLRTFRHAVNNHVAVIMAMAELSQRHPGQIEKFCQMCLEKGPQIVNTLRGFSESLEAALRLGRKPQTPTEN